jgi:upstream activation factor subunit UAF30
VLKKLNFLYVFVSLTFKKEIYTMSAATGSGKGSGLTKPMKVSEDLAVVIGLKEASRAQCIKMLWKYLKDHNLQDPENKQYFFPDKKMGKIFGNERIRAFGMAKFLGAHLSPI